jgi:exodeoxyribonuclease VII large subunit
VATRAAGNAAGSDRAGPRVLRVGELAARLAQLLDEAVGRVWVVGEISNLRRAASGHCYFTLKDDAGQLRAVLFRSDAGRLAFDLENGLAVLAFAEVSLYPARGELELVVRQLEPRGQGALRLAFEQLRARLSDEGLFDAAGKRELPPFPRRVGVVTSLHGAALHDVLEVAGARWPSLPLLVVPARVQGPGAESEVLEALQLVAAQPGIDVILLVRGGGSLEDLWPFNAEVLARAIARCPVPVVTGIGHETDVTIADLAADVRAPTPSAAAARVVPDRHALADRILRDRDRLAAAIGSQLAARRAQLRARVTALRHLSPAGRLLARRERSMRGGEALRAAALRWLSAARSRVVVAAGRLDSLSPLAVLARGYAIASRADGAIVRTPADVAVGDALAVRVAGGTLATRVTGIGDA